MLETVAAFGGCSLADLVRETGLTRPTAYRLATALRAARAARPRRDGRFQLGGRLVGWGAQAAGSSRLVDAARPVLARLAATTGESTQLYVRDGAHRICVAVHERPSGLRDTVPLGAVMPLTKGSGGKVLLAWAPDRDDFDVAPCGLGRRPAARVRAEHRRARGGRGERERAGAARPTAGCSRRSA